MFADRADGAPWTADLDFDASSVGVIDVGLTPFPTDPIRGLDVC